MAESLVICECLILVFYTSPSTVRDDECLFEIRESRVVLPAPEGPIIANISPGWQYPEQSLRIGFSFTLADKLCQVTEIILVFFIKKSLMSYQILTGLKENFKIK